MSISLVLACLLAMTSSKDYYWRNAYILIGIGIPLLGFVTRQNGPLVGLVVLIAATSVLRWPFVYLSRWIKSRVTGNFE